MKDYYKILQVDAQAEAEVITAAYHRLSRKYHPDTNKKPEATVKMQELNEAYEVLGNADKRKQYDATRGPQRPYSPQSHAQDTTPKYTIRPSVLNFGTLKRGQQMTMSIQIKLTDGVIPFGPSVFLEEDVSWVTCNTSSPRTYPVRVAVNVDTSSCSPGKYAVKLIIRMKNETNRIPIEMVVEELPQNPPYKPYQKKPSPEPDEGRKSDTRIPQKKLRTIAFLTFLLVIAAAMFGLYQQPFVHHLIADFYPNRYLIANNALRGLDKAGWSPQDEFVFFTTRSIANAQELTFHLFDAENQVEVFEQTSSNIDQFTAVFSEQSKTMFIFAQRSTTSGWQVVSSWNVSLETFQSTPSQQTLTELPSGYSYPPSVTFMPGNTKWPEGQSAPNVPPDAWMVFPSGNGKFLYFDINSNVYFYTP